MSEGRTITETKRVFTEEELCLMKKLGLTPEKISNLSNVAEKRERRLVARRQSCMLIEYYLKHVSICKLCGEVKIDYFKMEKEFTPDGSCLHSVPVSKEEFNAAEKTDKKVDEPLTCASCAVKLAEKTKEDLVMLCIKLQRRMIK